MTSWLPPLPVAGPLAIAGLLLATGHVLPRRLPDIVAIATAVAAAAICAMMAARAADGPLVYWFGGWVPRDGLVLGISFAVDQVGAALATFAGALFAATLVFAWGYYDEVHAHFHILMLLFMAAMIGFTLTHDLFNMFVWFEVMSVAAFALTGYQLRTDALEGALNFTIVNTVGSYLFLAGIGLIYAQAGALDMSAIARAVAEAPRDPVVLGAFALLATGLLIKAAQVPFHFWLSDAHAVAPSPVSVIFSGLMVALGIYGVAKLAWAVFPADPAIDAAIGTLLLGLGAASAVLGGLMALSQRHIKRLLAFSTISHTGILLIGLSLLRHDALTGMLVYLVGHGLVKGSLFMIAGILLATCGGIDELGLRGLGRGIRPAGVAMAVGGLALAGLPLGSLDRGFELIRSAAERSGHAWLEVPMVVATACTGAAVLRVTGRVFFGFGHVSGDEERAPTAEEQEKADRPLWLMLLPASTLLALALVGSHTATDWAALAAAQFMHPDAAAILGGATQPATAIDASLPPPPSSLLPWGSVGVAFLIAGFELGRGYLPRAFTGGVDRISTPLFDALQALHSGRIGDYIAWLTAGLALFALVLLLLGN